MSQAASRGNLTKDAISAMVIRLPVDVLYSELALASVVTRQQVVDIVDHLLLPLISTTSDTGGRRRMNALCPP